MPLEATLTSKGQITLPKALRDKLGLKKGSRIRFRVSAERRFEGDPILLDLEDLWAWADERCSDGLLHTRAVVPEAP